MTMRGTPFPVVPNKTMRIKCRRLGANVPEGWNLAWYAETSVADNYNVYVEWGYNE